MGGGERRSPEDLLWPLGHPTESARDVPGTVVENRQIAPGLWRLRIDVPLPWGPPTPGQFAQIVCPGDSRWRLRRPFSLAGWEEGKAGKGRIEIVYAPVGAETKRMTELREEESVELAGPLGVGFGVRSGRRAILVGGGRGIAPLLYLGERLAEHRHPSLLLYGYKSRDLRLPVASRIPMHEASEDGSHGFEGTVIDLLEELLTSEQVNPEDALYACGPTAMLRALASWASRRGLFLETSLETYFGCGYGVCAACAVPIREGEGYGAYAFACREGPVFNAEEVEWDDLVD
jgi:dihydroorotate dehydrogenase electron transfer subunit